VLGTGLSALAVGFITFRLGGWLPGPKLPLLESLLFGALMSSIDPVATLSILSSVGVRHTDTLYTLIFGESLLNDGVSIVLFDSLVRHAGDAGVVNAATVHATLREFFLVTFGSIIVGVLSAALATLYFWFLQGKQRAVVEVGLFFAWALVPYYVADGLRFSGIISILVMGLVMDYFVVGGNQSEEAQWMEYTAMPEEAHPVEPYLGRVRSGLADAFSGRGHLTTTTNHHVGFVAEVISSLMETAIFAYLGLFLFNEQSWNFMLMSTGIVACITSRAGMVVCLSLVINICVFVDLEGWLGRMLNIFRQHRYFRQDTGDSLGSDTKIYIDPRTQLILFSAGVRGAVSYALVQNIPDYNAVTQQGSHFKGELKAMTSATIVVLMFAFGALTYYSARRDWTPSNDRAAGPLTHRLMSNTLESDDGHEDGVDMDPLPLEMEAR
jgi:NhaP-type Na+/H+ or K+/H+ antiporter